MTSSLTRKIAHNAIAQFTGKIISIVLGVVAIAMLARALGQEGFGYYATVIAFLQFFGILVDFGLTITTSRLLAEPNADEPAILSNLMALRLTSGVLFFGAAALIALLFPYPAVVRIGIAMTTLSFLAVAINQMLLGYFQKILRTDIAALTEVLGRLVLVGGTAFAFFVHPTLLTMLGAIIGASVVTTILNYTAIRRRVIIRLRFDRAIWKRIIRISWPIGISIFFNLIYFKADTIILSLFRPAEEVGIYGAPYRVLEVLITFPFLFLGLVFPILVRLHKEKDEKRFHDIFQKTFDALAIMALPLVSGTVVLATPLMAFIAGDAFVASGPVLQILILATGIIFFGTLFGYLIVVADKQKTMILGYATTACIALIAYLLFIPRYGYMSAAWITVAAEGFVLFLTMIISKRHLNLHPSFVVLGKAFVASVCMSIVLWAVRASAHVLTLAGVGVILYSGFLYAFRGITKKTIVDIMTMSPKNHS